MITQIMVNLHETLACCSICQKLREVVHCPIKVKVNFSPFTTIQTVKSCITALAHVRKMLLRMSVNQVII